MKTKILTLILFVTALFISTSDSSAQIYTGGNMGVSFNNGYVIDMAPTLGYKYKIFQAGVNPFFTYMESTKQYAIGARLFTEVTVYKETFVRAEFEMANAEVWNGIVSNRKWIMALPIGAGYRYKISEGVYAWGSILYDVLHGPDSPTQNPIIRGGINYQL